MPNLPSVNANNISKLPSTSSTEDSVELLNLFTHYDEDQCAETVCTDKQLEPFTPWFLLRKTVDGVKSPPGRKYTKWPPDDEKVYFQAVRDNFITKCMHQALLRGDDIRSKSVTWAHNRLLRVVIDGQRHYLFFILKDSGKAENKKKKIQSYLTGYLRHVNPMLCPVCAQGIYYIMAFGKGEMRDFPNVFDPDNNWAEKCYLDTAWPVIFSDH